VATRREAAQPAAGQLERRQITDGVRNTIDQRSYSGGGRRTQEGERHVPTARIGKAPVGLNLRIATQSCHCIGQR
jgi:hypothetical protein